MRSRIFFFQIHVEKLFSSVNYAISDKLIGKIPQIFISKN
jgi:hypothetical protein